MQFDPIKIITRLSRENERQVKLIDELNIAIENQSKAVSQLAADLTAQLKEHNEMVNARLDKKFDTYTRDLETMSLDATKIIAELCKISDEVRERLNGCVK